MSTRASWLLCGLSLSTGSWHLSEGTGRSCGGDASLDGQARGSVRWAAICGDQRWCHCYQQAAAPPPHGHPRKSLAADDRFLGYHVLAAVSASAASENVTTESHREQTRRQPRQPGHLRCAPRLPDYLKEVWEGEGLKFFPEWMGTKLSEDTIFYSRQI